MLQNELDRGRTVSYARRHWFKDNEEALQRRTTQAVVACDLAERWHQEERSFLTPAMRHTIESCWHATMLTGALDRHGACFEDIVVLTNLETATMLAAITPDNRLPPPRRILMHISDLGQAEPCAQIVRLVQLFGVVSAARRRFMKNPERERDWLKETIPELDRYVEALWRLGEFCSLAEAWRHAKHVCTLLCQVLDQWRQRGLILAKLHDPKPQVKARPALKRILSGRSPGGNRNGHDHSWYN